MDAHRVLRALNSNVNQMRATAASLAECTQLQQHHTEIAADRARDRARADAQRRKEQNRVRERLRSASRRQSAGGVKRERERESLARRWQLAGDVERERGRESTAARRQSQSYGTSILRHHNTQARAESGTIRPSKRGGRRGEGEE